MSAQQQVNPGSRGRVCSSEAVVTGPLGLAVAMASKNVFTLLFVSLPQPEFSEMGDKNLPPPRSVAEAQDRCFPLTLGDVWKGDSILCFPLGRMNPALDKHLARGRLHPGSPSALCLGNLPRED